MKFFYFLLILISSFDSHANWKDQDDFRTLSATFSHTKYFSFYSDKVSGHISYIHLSPSLVDKFYLLGSVTVNGVQHSIFYPSQGSCVIRHMSKVTTHVCNKAGIIQRPDDTITLWNNDGKLKWSLNFKKSSLYNQIQEYRVDFGKKWFEKILPSDWSTSWRVIDPSMSVSGWVESENKKVYLDQDTVAYHDEVWGNWNFLTQPYFWVYVPIRLKDRNINIIVGDVYYNKKNRLMGMTITDGDSVTRYESRHYSVIINELRPSKSLPLILHKNTNSDYINTMESIATGSSVHQYPHRITIVTHDGKIKISAVVRMISPYMVKLPLAAEKIYSPSWSDDMIIDADYVIKDLNGFSVEGKTIGGMEYFQTKSIGLPTIIMSSEN